MSDVSVDIIKNRSGEAPDLPSGANLSGVSTAATLQVTNLNPTHINASGVTTATTFSGSLKSTGTPTLGLGVTINSSGINISGVATAGIVSATTLYGDGSNLTGVAMSIAPITYNPDVNDTLVTTGTGIGITFTERIKAGSGNVTLRLVSAGGTVVENFGVGSSVTIANNTVSISPSSSLSLDTLYHLSYPSGAFTNTAGDVSYVGTAYTFKVKPLYYELWGVGANSNGNMAQNSTSVTQYSSPVQIPGNDWKEASFVDSSSMGIKNDGTLWAWGGNASGSLGLNQPSDTRYSSPVQIGSASNWTTLMKQGRAAGENGSAAINTDGELFVWGGGYYGSRGLNGPVNVGYSSPVQIPGTNWRDISCAQYHRLASKTDGTLWAWGRNNDGQLAQGHTNFRSSPVQIPGTNWSTANWIDADTVGCVRTDGTLWVWGHGGAGGLAQNSQTQYSSPRQVGSETTWGKTAGKFTTGQQWMAAVKTDGTLWMWGANNDGKLGQNNTTSYSSPIQVPGTTWDTVHMNPYRMLRAFKTDGTMWTWGGNPGGKLGLNNTVKYSSPVQVPGTDYVPSNSTGMFFRKNA